MNEPRIAPESVNNAPTSTIGDHSPQANASIQDRTGLFISILALVVAAFGCGMAVTLFVLVPGMIDAKVQAGVAAANADMAAAKQNARLALDRVDKTMARLEARGLIKLEDH